MSTSSSSSAFKAEADIGNWTLQGNTVTYTFSAPKNKKQREDIGKKFQFQVNRGIFDTRANYIEVPQYHYTFNWEVEQDQRRIEDSTEYHPFDPSDKDLKFNNHPTDNHKDYNKRWWWNWKLQAFVQQGYKDIKSWDEYIHCFDFEQREADPVTLPCRHENTPSEEYLLYYCTILDCWHTEQKQHLDLKLINQAIVLFCQKQNQKYIHNRPINIKPTRNSDSDTEESTSYYKRPRIH